MNFFIIILFYIIIFFYIKNYFILIDNKKIFILFIIYLNEYDII